MIFVRIIVIIEYSVLIFLSKSAPMRQNLTRANVFKDREDKVPSILISQSVVAMGYFYIAFCPMCGRKLVEE